jgi:hypothetical protein
MLRRPRWRASLKKSRGQQGGKKRRWPYYYGIQPGRYPDQPFVKELYYDGAATQLLLNGLTPVTTDSPQHHIPYIPQMPQIGIEGRRGDVGPSLLQLGPPGPRYASPFGACSLLTLIPLVSTRVARALRSVQSERADRELA